MKKKLFGVLLAAGLMTNIGSLSASCGGGSDYDFINWTEINDIPEMIDPNYEHIKDVAQYKLADWSQVVGRKNGITVQEAKQIADQNPDITYFFYTTGYRMVLENPNGVRVFNHGDAVFFSGTPWWGSAPGLADGYVKTSL